MALLEIKDLHVDVLTEEGTFHVLRGVNLSLPKRATLGLVGESGSGKSMTALSVLRLLPEGAAITCGRIVFGQIDLTAMGERKLASVRGNKIALIFQNALSSLNPFITAAQHVADAYARHAHVGPKAAQSRAIELLEMTGISSDYAKSYPHELSGGMCQRVMIAVALACSPEILIADEPTTGLDVTIQVQVVELIEDLVRRMGASLVFISHDIGMVSEICAQTAVMYAGRIVEVGPTEEVTAEPAHPYTVGLLRSFRDRSGTRMPFIPGRVPDLRVVPLGCSFSPRCPLASSLCNERLPEMRRIDGERLVACHRVK